MLKEISVEILRKCPNSCIHCSSGSDINCTEYLSLELIKNIIDDFDFLGGETFYISGGEPLLHKDIFKIIKYAKEKNLTVVLYTGGVLLNKGKLENITSELLLKLEECGLDKLILNSQSIKYPTYAKICRSYDVPDKYATYINSILSLKYYNVNHTGKLSIEVNVVPNKINYKEFPELLAYFQRINLKVNILKLVLHGRAKQNKKLLKLSMFQDFLLTLKLRKYHKKYGDKCIRIGTPFNKNKKCNAVRRKLYIRYDGSVFGCETFKYVDILDEDGNEIKPDNVKEKRLKEIISGGNSKYLVKSLDIIDKNCHKCKLFTNCPMQKY